MNDDQIEQDIQAKGLTAPRITPQDIESNIANEFYFTAAEGLAGREVASLRGPEAVPSVLHMVAFCVLILRNGHKIVGVNEGPVSPENFDAELGRKLARQKAIDQIWPLMGYELKCRLHERSQ